MSRKDKYTKPEVVVITGASAGVGRAVAREFGKRGSNVALLARGEDGLRAAQREVIELGGKAEIYKADVSDPAQVEKAAEKIEKQFGPIDIWINNAMNSVFSPISEMQPEDYKRVTEVTYLGYVYGALSALKRMKPRDKGKIIFVGSALAYRGIPLQSAYCAAKHAIAGFYDSLRSELIHDKSNVKVSIIHLPAMNTPQFSWVKSRLPNKPKPMGRIYQPEVAAKAIVYAADYDRREIQVGLPTVEAILGDKIAPWFMDWWLGKKGYQGQQTDEPESPDRCDNLYEPVPGDHGPHGIFEKDAHAFSPQTWLTLNRGKALLTVGGIISGVLLVRKLFDLKMKENISQAGY
ncbi:MAG: SDR family oxidoreductase [Cytophagaceae bacterium]|nr:SDR family oxidoreductase [Cytophagaceae bacterium]